VSEPDSYVHSIARMGTVVAIRVVGAKAMKSGRSSIDEHVSKALAWFDRVESACSRFDEQSELQQISARVGVAVPVSAILFRAVQFALQVAEETAGAFDPTVGLAMEENGFNHHYRTGETRHTLLEVSPSTRRPSFRDVQLDAGNQTITLLRPLLLDLGAVAKGLAIDLAAKELEPLENFLIDAGGDIYVSGTNARNEPWSVGIRHPRTPNENLHVLSVSDAAVCTSGDYERKGVRDATHHLLDPRTGESARGLASATVVAPTAMMADALATAAFVLGPVEGLRLLERSEVEGLLVTPELEQFSTPGFGDEADEK
jgi:thiamine biosynthesis lipoprotein